MISKNLSMLFSKKRAIQLCDMVGVASACMMLVFLMGATEINIGENNKVNTGKVVGGNCLQGNGNVTQKQLTVGQFTDIIVDGIFKVTITCGKKQELTISAEENLHSLISAVVKSGKLHLSTTGSYCATNTFVADISLQNLASITADDSSELVVSCNAAVNDKLTIDLRGASSMAVSGMIKDVSIKLQDSTELDAFQLKVESVEIKASDAATAHVNVSKKLIGQGSDASTINYRGRPQKVQVTTVDASDCSPED